MAVSVWPALAVPLTVGSELDVGAAAVRSAAASAEPDAAMSRQAPAKSHRGKRLIKFLSVMERMFRTQAHALLRVRAANGRFESIRFVQLKDQLRPEPLNPE